MSTSSRLKMNIGRLLIVCMVCLALYIATSSMANAISVSVVLAPDSRSLTTKVVVSGTGFDVREMITINVGFPGSYPDKRYHDWLGPIEPSQVMLAYGQITRRTINV